jgi:hypothetical protein
VLFVIQVPVLLLPNDKPGTGITLRLFDEFPVVNVNNKRPGSYCPENPVGKEACK